MLRMILIVASLLLPAWAASAQSNLVATKPQTAAVAPADTPLLKACTDAFGYSSYQGRFDFKHHFSAHERIYNFGHSVAPKLVSLNGSTVCEVTYRWTTTNMSYWSGELVGHFNGTRLRVEVPSKNGEYGEFTPKGRDLHMIVKYYTKQWGLLTHETTLRRTR